MLSDTQYKPIEVTFADGSQNKKFVAKDYEITQVGIYLKVKDKLGASTIFLYPWPSIKCIEYYELLF